MKGLTVGMLSPFVGGDYYGALIGGVNRAVAARGGRTLAIQTLDPGSHSADRCGIPDFRRPVAWRHLDAVAVAPGAVDRAYVEAMRRAGLPVVLIGHRIAGLDCPAVLVDNRTGVRAAIDHLVGHGHRTIAFVGNLDTYDVRERYQAYRAGLAAHGLPWSDDLLHVVVDNHEEGGVDAAEAIVASGRSATAVVLGTDRNAIGLIGHLRAAGLDLPRDQAVVGFDDIPDTRYVVPSLSSVRQPLDQVGGVAVERLVAMLAGRPVGDEPTYVPTTFVPRNSCGCAVGGLSLTEQQARTQFADITYLQSTLNTQYELGSELLRTHDHDPRRLDWLGRTPALGGYLGLWPSTPDDRDDDPRIEVVGAFRRDLVTAPPAPVSAFPPADLFALTDGLAGDIIFVVPVRSAHRDWGMLAAVGRIQEKTPPGREMMNQSGSLLAVALDQDALLTSLRRQEERLRYAALHDQLTGLPNRVRFLDRLGRALERTRHQPNFVFAVLFLDLDGFKAVNDQLGHAAGDQLLVAVADRIRAELRQTDIAARFGGDEFLVLLDGVRDTDMPVRTVERLRKVLADPYTLDAGPARISASIGLTLSSPGYASPEDVLRDADHAMYRAKSRAKAALRAAAA